MIDDIRSDLADGTILLQLMSILDAANADKFKSYHTKPKLTFHKTENVDKVLSYLRAQSLPLVGITAGSIADGSNLNALLGLIWILITKYDINSSKSSAHKADDASSPAALLSPTSQTVSAKDRLLYWCQDQANSGDQQPQVNIKSFADLSDGVVFCRLVNHLQASAIDLSHLPSSAEETVQLAFDTADRELGIANILDAAEVANNINNIDSQSLMTYISFFRNFRSELRDRRRENTRVQSLAKTINADSNNHLNKTGHSDSVVEAQFAGQTKKIADLQQTITQLQAELETARLTPQQNNVVEESKGSNGDNVDVAKLQSEMLALKESVAESEKRAAAALADAHRAEERAKEAEHKTKTTAAAAAAPLEAQATSNVTDKSDNSSSSEDVAKLEAEIAELKRRHDQLTRDHEQTVDELENVKKEAASTDTTAPAATTAAHTEEDVDFDSVTDRPSDWESALKRLTDKHQFDLRIVATEYENRTKALDTKLKAAEATARAAQLESLQSSQRVDEEKREKERRDLEDETKRLRESLRTNSQRFEAVTAQLKAFEEKHKSAEDKLKAQLNEYKNKAEGATTLTTKLTEAQRELAEERRTVQVLRSQVDVVKKRTSRPVSPAPVQSISLAQPQANNKAITPTKHVDFDAKDDANDAGDDDEEKADSAAAVGGGKKKRKKNRKKKKRTGVEAAENDENDGTDDSEHGNDDVAIPVAPSQSSSPTNANIKPQTVPVPQHPPPASATPAPPPAVDKNPASSGGGKKSGKGKGKAVATGSKAVVSGVRTDPSSARQVATHFLSHGRSPYIYLTAILVLLLAIALIIRWSSPDAFKHFFQLN